MLFLLVLVYKKGVQAMIYRARCKLSNQIQTGFLQDSSCFGTAAVPLAEGGSKNRNVKNSLPQNRNASNRTAA